MLHKPEALIDREDNICHKTGFSLHKRKMPRKKIMQKRKETDMSTQQPDSLMGIMLEYFRHASQLPISTLCSEAGISTKTYLKLKKKIILPL